MIITNEMLGVVHVKKELLERMMVTVTIAMVLWSMEMKLELLRARNVRWEKFQGLTTTKDTSDVGFA